MADAAVDISDLPAPPVDISDLPTPPPSHPTARSVVGRNPTMGNFDSGPGASVSDLTQAGASGMNANVADVLGFPMDTATNVTNLLKGGASAAMLGAGYSPPSWLNFDKPEDVPGTSDYLKKKARAVDPNLVDVAPNDSGQDLSAVHTLAEQVGPGGVAGEAARVAGAIREGRAAVSVGAPKSTPKPAPSGGFKAEDLVEKPAATPAPAADVPKADVAPESSAAPVSSGKASEPIRGTPDADGAHQYTDEQRAQVTDRHWKRVGVSVDAKTGETSVVDPEAYAQARKDYEAHEDSAGGKILNTDIARDLSVDYNDSKEARSALAADVHEPSSAFIKQLYKDKLAEAPKDGEEPLVMFTPGGTGAGKSTAITNTPELAAMRDRAHIVYDTNMNKLGSAQDKIQQAIAAGHDVHVAYVYRDPVEAFANGTLSRAERQGRTVPIAEQQKTHAGAYQTVKTLQENPDPLVNFTTLDNSRGKGNQAIVSFQSLAGKRTMASLPDLRAVAETKVKQPLDKGGISKRVYNGTLGSEGTAADQGGTGGQSGSRPLADAGTKAVTGTTSPGEAVPGSGSGVRGGNGQKPAQGNGEAKSLDHPLEFVPPEAEGTKSAAVPSQEQESRADTLRALGLQETRHSAVSGDYKETGTDFQTSKLDNAAGKRMDTVMQNERQALRDYSENLVENSGGTAETDAIARRARGKTIAAPIEAYDKALETETKKLYATADQRAAGHPIEMPSVRAIMADESEFLGTTEGEQLLKGLKAKTKTLGLLGPTEAFNPATVEQAERLRQWLNENYSPRAGKLIAKLKDAITDDVTKAAGSDIYAAGRKVRAARAMNLEEPEGVSKLLAPDDRLGINRDVAHEDIPKYVTSLEADQFDHVVRVLKAAGKNPDIAPKSAAALNEIRATFANAVRDAGESTQGMWNAKGVNKYLRDNNARMSQVFSPEEMGQYQTLNDGGRILRMDRTYPGAAAQGHNFVVGGVLKGAEHGATVAGGLMGHIPGAAAGYAISKGAKTLDAHALSAAVEKRIRTL